jgi:hypothetical protein
MNIIRRILSLVSANSRGGRAGTRPTGRSVGRRRGGKQQAAATGLSLAQKFLRRRR